MTLTTKKIKSTLAGAATFLAFLAPSLTFANETVTYTVKPGDTLSEIAEKYNTTVEKIGEKIEAKYENTSFIINPYVTKVSIVGIGLISNVGVASKMFKILAENDISFHQISTSEISISLIVDEVMGKRVAELFAKEFDL